MMLATQMHKVNIIDTYITLTYALLGDLNESVCIDTSLMVDRQSADRFFGELFFTITEIGELANSQALSHM